MTRRIHHFDDGVTPPLDFDALHRRMAQRSSAEDAARQAHLDSWQIGRDALVLGEQQLAAGNLERARDALVIAARHDALDATALLHTVILLLDALDSLELTGAATDTAQASVPVGLEGDPDLVTQRAQELVHRLDSIEARIRDLTDEARRTHALIAEARDKVAACLDRTRIEAAAILERARTQTAEAEAGERTGSDTPFVTGTFLDTWLANRADGHVALPGTEHHFADHLGLVHRKQIAFDDTIRHAQSDNEVRAPALTAPRHVADCGPQHHAAVVSLTYAFGTARQAFLDRQLQVVVDKALSVLHELFPRAAVHIRPDGDSMTVLIGPDVPKAWLLADFVLRELVIALHDANRGTDDMHRLRVRCALGHGETVVNAPHLGGIAVLDTARLVDAQPLRDLVESDPRHDLCLIISDRFYRDIVTTSQRGLDRGLFKEVHLNVKDFQGIGWLFLPAAAGGASNVARVV
jgi:hypothetical protein